MKLTKITKYKSWGNIDGRTEMEYYIDAEGRIQGNQTSSLYRCGSIKPYRIYMYTYIDDKLNGTHTRIERDKIVGSYNIKNGIYHGKSFEIIYDIILGNKKYMEESSYIYNVKDGFSSYYTYDKMNNSIFSHQTLFINHKFICRSDFPITIDIENKLITWLKSQCEDSDTKSRISYLHHTINDKYNNWIFQYLY